MGPGGNCKPGEGQSIIALNLSIASGGFALLPLNESVALLSVGMIHGYLIVMMIIMVIRQPERCQSNSLRRSAYRDHCGQNQ